MYNHTMNQLNRRDFVKTSAAVGSYFVLPSGLLANSPNGRVCTAHIGTGGKGRVDTGELVKHMRVQPVAFCDVDSARGMADSWLSKHKSAKFFQDYREMLATLGDKVDVVSISTPDHTHYPATMAAMKLGKHVFTQKPLTHKLAEARELAEFAAEKKLTTQMGIQNQSRAAYRFTRHHIKAGIIGKIKKVYVWSFKNWGYDGKPFAEKSAVSRFTPLSMFGSIEHRQIGGHRWMDRTFQLRDPCSQAGGFGCDLRRHALPGVMWAFSSHDASQDRELVHDRCKSGKQLANLDS